MARIRNSSLQRPNSRFSSSCPYRRTASISSYASSRRCRPASPRSESSSGTPNKYRTNGSPRSAKYSRERVAAGIASSGRRSQRCTRRFLSGPSIAVIATMPFCARVAHDSKHTTTDVNWNERWSISASPPSEPIILRLSARKSNGSRGSNAMSCATPRRWRLGVAQVPLRTNPRLVMATPRGQRSRCRCGPLSSRAPYCAVAVQKRGLEPSPETVGIDIGLWVRMTLSNGTVVPTAKSN